MKKPWYEKAWNSVEGFWQFLDGKKNKIANAGLSVYAAAETAVQLGVIPDHTIVAQAVLYASVVFKILGIGHKVKKGEIELRKSTSENELPEGLR